ncbi:hypothetical protein VULLAG_LOCUS2200 [Vulpes lagopus]
MPMSLWGWALAKSLHLWPGEGPSLGQGTGPRQLGWQLARGHGRDEPFGRDGDVWWLSTMSRAAQLPSKQAPGPSAFLLRRQVLCVGSRAAAPRPQHVQCVNRGRSLRDGHQSGGDPGSGLLGDHRLLPPVCPLGRREMLRALAAVGVGDLLHSSPCMGHSVSLEGAVQSGHPPWVLQEEPDS